MSFNQINGYYLTMEDWSVGKTTVKHKWSMSKDGSMDKGSMDKGSMDNRSMDNGGMMDNRSMDRCRSVGRNSFIGDLSNITAVCISSVVGDNLGSAIRKSNPVGSRGCVSISLLVLAVPGSAVIISNSVLVGVHCRLIIGWFRGVPRGRREAQGSGNKAAQNNNSLQIYKNYKKFYTEVYN